MNEWQPQSTKGNTRAALAPYVVYAAALLLFVLWAV